MAAICFEPVAGASGDMILAALFDLGADPGKVGQLSPRDRTACLLDRSGQGFGKSHRCEL